MRKLLSILIKGLTFLKNKFEKSKLKIQYSKTIILDTEYWGTNYKVLSVDKPKVRQNGYNETEWGEINMTLLDNHEPKVIKNIIESIRTNAVSNKNQIQNYNAILIQEYMNGNLIGTWNIMNSKIVSCDFGTCSNNTDNQYIHVVFKPKICFYQLPNELITEKVVGIPEMSYEELCERDGLDVENEPDYKISV